MGGEVKVPSLLARVLGMNEGEIYPWFVRLVCQAHQYWASELLQPTTTLSLYEEGTLLAFPLTYPRCDLGTQPVTPSSSQKAVSRGVSGPLKVNATGGGQLRTKCARSIASGKLRKEESK